MSKFLIRQAFAEAMEFHKQNKFDEAVLMTSSSEFLIIEVSISLDFIFGSLTSVSYTHLTLPTKRIV